jgi:uridine kinase
MGEQLTLSGLLQPVVLAVAGCSGSGKTTLARELAAQLNGVLFPLDFYYRDLTHLSRAERDHYNFDHPESLEHDLIVRHVQTLREGGSVDRPTYDFNTHSRVHGLTEHISSQRFLIVEGILALHYVDLLPLYDLTVYVDAPHDVCLTRRIHRDVRERGRTEASVIEQFNTYARPMADEYVLPCRGAAEITVSGTEALDWSIEQVLAALRRRALLPQDSASLTGLARTSGPQQ